MAEEPPKLGEELQYEEALDENSLILQLKTGMHLSKVRSFLNPQRSPNPLHPAFSARYTRHIKVNLLAIIALI